MTNEALKAASPDAVDTAMPTHELMSWLGDAERDRFVKLQETFESAGWKLIVEYANAKTLQHGVDGANAQTWDKCVENRGARYAWQQVMQLHDEFMNAFENAAREAQMANAAEAAGD